MNAYEHLMEKAAAQAAARGVGALAGRAIRKVDPAKLRAAYQTARSEYNNSPWAQVASRFAAASGLSYGMGTLGRLHLEARKRAREAAERLNKGSAGHDSYKKLFRFF